MLLYSNSQTEGILTTHRIRQRSSEAEYTCLPLFHFETIHPLEARAIEAVPTCFYSKGRKQHERLHDHLVRPCEYTLIVRKNLRSTYTMLSYVFRVLDGNELFLACVLYVSNRTTSSSSATVVYSGSR